MEVKYPRSGQSTAPPASSAARLFAGISSAKSSRWGVPSGRVPTTHILKPPPGEWDGQAENEHWVGDGLTIMCSFVTERPPPKRRPRLYMFLSYEWEGNLRRAIPAKPRTPVPSRAKVDASGTGESVPEISQDTEQSLVRSPYKRHSYALQTLFGQILPVTYRRIFSISAVITHCNL